MTNTLPGEIAKVREQFLSVAEGVRPELHRYCARLTGSVIEGEDIVQETLAKAFYALSLAAETPELRPWLFRIAHNTAMDFLKSHGRKQVEMRAEMDDVADVDERPDPTAVRAALSRFLALPSLQRSAVILKDVLGHSLEETAETMGTSIPAVKSALVRGRATLRETEPDETKPKAHDERAQLDAYVALFNARDWTGLRAVVGEDCRLDLVSKSARRGKEVGFYFTRYENEPNIEMRVLQLEGRDVIGVFKTGAERPQYFILLEWIGDRVSFIRDFRYVPYIAIEAELEK